MKKLTIGIPKALLYYQDGIFFKNYFENLGHKVIISEDTTKETITQGKKYSIDESCLPSKIYLGHVASLQNKCDYIFIERIENYGKGEKVCVKFNATYDLVKNLFPNENFLVLNIEKNKHPFLTLTYLKLGLTLNQNLLKVLKSYALAKHLEKKRRKKQELLQLKKLNSNKLKILIISHPYNIYDNYLGKPIIKKLTNLNTELIYANLLNKKIARMYAKQLSPTLYWTYSKELIGAIPYYQYSVDGIIFLTAFPCGPDSLVNELCLRKVKELPTINILIDELSSQTGLETRLESFIDILNQRRNLSE